MRLRGVIAPNSNLVNLPDLKALVFLLHVVTGSVMVHLQMRDNANHREEV